MKSADRARVRHVFTALKLTGPTDADGQLEAIRLHDASTGGTWEEDLYDEPNYVELQRDVDALRAAGLLGPR